MPTTYTQDIAAPLPVVLQAKTNTTTTRYLFATDTRPLAEYDIAWEYLLPDGLGSVRQIADASGAVKLTEAYEPYGSLLSRQGSATSVFGFTGEQTDVTGLVFLRARYMQPVLGVFLSRDPWEGNYESPLTLNSYLYVLANPVNYTDPSGQQCTGCRTPGDWAEFTLFYGYGIRLVHGPSKYVFHESEKQLILETVADYANLLGGPGILRRNLKLFEIMMEWVEPDGSYNAGYDPYHGRIILQPGWYDPAIVAAPNGQARIILASPCLDGILGPSAPPTARGNAKFILAHEMGHAFHAGNPRVLRSFTNRVALPPAFMARSSPNPIIARNAFRDTFEQEVFSDALAADLL